MSCVNCRKFEGICEVCAKIGDGKKDNEGNYINKDDSLKTVKYCEKCGVSFCRDHELSWSRVKVAYLEEKEKGNNFIEATINLTKKVIKRKKVNKDANSY